MHKDMDKDMDIDTDMDADADIDTDTDMDMEEDMEVNQFERAVITELKKVSGELKRINENLNKRVSRPPNSGDRRNKHDFKRRGGGGNRSFNNKKPNRSY